MDFKPSSIRMWSRLGPSGALGAVAMEIGKNNERAVFITADMTFASGLERFKNKYPDRLYNAGIAEQNMIGLALGLASEGYEPYVVTYASFLATRALDQMKMCLGYMKGNVKAIGINGGLAAGVLGATHMAIEDISAIRAIPNILIESPADTTELVKTMLDIGSHEGPAYIRFTGGMNDEVVYGDDFDFSIGKANRVCSGDDIVILATGNMVRVAMGISEELLKRNICCSVYDFHTIKPLDDAVIKEALNYKMIATIEEHSIIGGFGSSVLEVVNDKYLYNGRIRRYGIADAYPHAASHEAILKKCGLTVDMLADSIESEYKRI